MERLESEKSGVNKVKEKEPNWKWERSVLFKDWSVKKEIKGDYQQPLSREEGRKAFALPVKPNQIRQSTGKISWY